MKKDVWIHSLEPGKGRRIYIGTPLQNANSSTQCSRRDVHVRGEQNNLEAEKVLDFRVVSYSISSSVPWIGVPSGRKE